MQSRSILNSWLEAGKSAPRLPTVDWEQVNRLEMLRILDGLCTEATFAFLTSTVVSLLVFIYIYTIIYVTSRK